MRNDRAAGFTMIEVMVALAVFSLAALALIRLEGATIRGAGILDATLMADAVAQNVAITATSDNRPPATGTLSGTERNGGRDWRWTRLVSSLGGGRALRIDVAVADTTGRSIGRTTMVRAARTLDGS